MAIKAAELQVVIGADTQPAVTGIERAAGLIKQAVASALGFLGSQVISNTLGTLQSLSREAVSAVLEYERLAFSIESMMAAELRAADASLTMTDALNQARDKARETLKWLESLSLVSPFESKTVQSVYQMQIRLGASSDEAKRLTEALLNLGAASGLTSADLAGAGYALAQIRASEKLLMQDLRQLINAGIDVNAILARMGYSLADVGKKAISTADFIKAFYEQAAESGDAVARMSMTLSGMAGALSDFRQIAMREVFGPILEGLKPLISMFVEWLMGPARDALANFGQRTGQFMAKISSLAEIIRQAGLFSSDFARALNTISPALGRVWQFALPLVERVFGWLRDHANEISAAIKAIITALVGIAAISGIAAIISALANPLTLIIATIGLLAAAWQGNWGGIREHLLGFWAQAQPILAHIWQWLSTNIPQAIQALAAWWEGILIPAMQAAWEWISANLIPVLANIGIALKDYLIVYISNLVTLWEQALLPTLQAWWTILTNLILPTLLSLGRTILEGLGNAINVLVAAWNERLKPALITVWNFVSNYILPLLISLADFISAVLSVALTILAGLWKNILLPAIQAVWSWLAEKLHPILLVIAEGIERLARWIGERLAPAFDRLKDGIRAATEWFTKMADRIRNLQLPAWLTPGSPTPLEIGLRGIAKAMDNIARKGLPDIRTGLALERPIYLPMTTGQGKQSGTTINANISFAQTDLTPESLQRALKMLEWLYA